eukprot:15242710-Ditylum_brightwellii.AAC.1
MGFNQSTPKVIIFATQRYSGLQLLHPQCEQVAERINFVVKYLRADANIGRVITIALWWVQLCAGALSHMLQDNRPIPRIDGVWIEHLQNGMEPIKAKIHHKYEWAVPMQRKGDKHIMAEFLENKLIPENAMKPLIYCRYFVEATTLADIVTSDGKRIRTELFDPEKFQNEEEKQHRLAQGTWPRHAEPDKSVQKLWKDALMKMVCNEQGVLHLPPGD